MAENETQLGYVSLNRTITICNDRPLLQSEGQICYIVQNNLVWTKANGQNVHIHETNIKIPAGLNKEYLKTNHFSHLSINT